MKVRRGATAAALVAGAAAQTTSSQSLPVSYTTMTVDDCPSASLETLITVTQGLTITYCPECEWGGSGGPTLAPTTSKGPGHTTTYTTTYLSLCETGTVPVTYTVTESCEEPTPTWTPGPSHIPNGFTVTVKECTVCDKTPVPVTITEPCDCDATSGIPASPKPTSEGGKPPIQQIPDGQVQNPAPGGGSGSGPAPTGSWSNPDEGCDGTSCGGSGSGSTPPPSGGSGSNPPSGGSGSNPPSGGSGSNPPSGGSGSNPPSGGSGSNPPSGGSGSNPASSGGNKPPVPSGGSGGGSTPPYPTTSAAAPQCPGPECRAKATGGAGGPGDSYPTGNTSNITPPPYEGMASTSQLGFITSIVLSFIVGGFAFAL
ncbi:hypothetical protein M409DRAFT_20901 [Zasmidium cellare ATCC 36951]|uniref:Uncharacterized protein n=1 Tax=Zasmidium cellare ATCC 36951 TaxID=1080233 RepID=A0A6A6CNM9_ZASCE|nr:uncharacterized protein M409DRAFT_20901 [Zasmidium cellare ATCC 36951]KAF2168887.1 hypothetical protein M409DRAFT_20901 [Zasmidium cellare ATCC 36951]